MPLMVRIILIMQIVISAAVWYFVMRYNMHMFQLNSYKNMEQMRWLRRNYKREGVLVIPFILGTATGIYPVIPVSVIFLMIHAFVLYYFIFLRRYHNKKRLVFTTRVIRMILTDAVLSVIITDAIALGICFALLYADGTFIDVIKGGGNLWESRELTALLAGEVMGLCTVTIFQPFIIMLANLINRPVEKLVAQYYINDAKKILRSNPNLTIIGITGSFGKTSVKYYLNTLLSSKYDVLMTPGNYNTTLGITKTVRSSLKSSHEIFICEMGARYVGDIKDICKLVRPDHCIVTAVGPQHLDTFGGIDKVCDTKFELVDSVTSEGKGGIILLNGDNEYIRKRATHYNDVTFYDTKEFADSTFYAKDIKVSQLGSEFTFVVNETAGSTERAKKDASGKGNAEGRFTTRLVGLHNIINIVGAMGMAYRMGMTLDEMKIPVRRLASVPHRMEMKDHGDVTIIDDAYNSNPVGSKAAVETLAMFDGCRILVTPGMVELGKDEEEYNYRFGTYAAKACDYIALVGEKHTAPIYKGIIDSGFESSRVQVFSKVGEAIDYAYAIKAEGHKYILLENDLPDNY